MRASVLWLVGVFVLACGEEAAETPVVDVAADARALAAVIDDDQCGPAIDDAMHAMDTDRPVMAAEILGESAVPAARQMLSRIELLRPTTSDGRTLRTRGLQAGRARVAALEHLRDALARGPVEDDVLLDAIHESAEAERDLQLLRTELAVHAPLPERAEVPGAAPIHTTDPRDEGDTTDEPGEGEPTPGELEDGLPEM